HTALYGAISIPAKVLCQGHQYRRGEGVIQPMTTIYWAGDSTVKENSILTYPQTGMGQVFGRFVRRMEVRVENHSENGRSTKSFLEEGRLETIRERMQPGDFLFIQFGHNDEKAEDPARYTSPEDTFRGYLAVFVK